MPIPPDPASRPHPPCHQPALTAVRQLQQKPRVPVRVRQQVLDRRPTLAFFRSSIAIIFHDNWDSRLRLRRNNGVTVTVQRKPMGTFEVKLSRCAASGHTLPAAVRWLAVSLVVIAGAAAIEPCRGGRSAALYREPETNGR